MNDGLAPRAWLADEAVERVEALLSQGRDRDLDGHRRRLDDLVATNRRIHDVECVNLNPATNTMSSAASAALAGGLGTRTSLGHAGAKYEMGLEAIEEIEVIAADLAARVFGSAFVEFRVPSGAMANLMTFMSCARPGDAVIVPPATIAGHVTHHAPGAAGLYGLEIHEAPIDPHRYSVEPNALADLAQRVRPKIITLGSSLNLRHHDVAAVRAVADQVGATLMFDAAHLAGPIAGGAWPNPLDAGAHVMTMSAYKSLAGPPSGLVLTNDPEIAERLDAIAFPGLTANFDAGKTTALAYTLTDWLEHGHGYASAMVAAASALAMALVDLGVDVHRPGGVATESHAFAIEAAGHGGGGVLAKRLRTRNLLASAIGLPAGTDHGLRIGTNEIVRWGAGSNDMAALAELVARACSDEPAAQVAADVSQFRQRFDEVAFTSG